MPCHTLQLVFSLEETEVCLRGITKIKDEETFLLEFTSNLCLEVNKTWDN